MKWIDSYIDRLHESIPRIGSVSPPFSRWGSIINAVMSSGITLYGVYLGITDSPFGFVLALAAAGMATVFIRVAVRAQAGDFDA